MDYQMNPPELNIENDPVFLEIQNMEEKIEDKTKFNTGRWTREEHLKFIEGLIKYGNNWKLVESHIKTRTSTQARSHSQKFFLRLRRKLKLSESDEINYNFLRKLPRDIIMNFLKDEQSSDDFRQDTNNDMVKVVLANSSKNKSKEKDDSSSSSELNSCEITKVKPNNISDLSLNVLKCDSYQIINRIHREDLDIIKFQKSNLSDFFKINDNLDVKHIDSLVFTKHISNTNETLNANLNHNEPNPLIIPNGQGTKTKLPVKQNTDIELFSKSINLTLDINHDNKSNEKLLSKKRIHPKSKNLDSRSNRALYENSSVRSNSMLRNCIYSNFSTNNLAGDDLHKENSQLRQNNINTYPENPKYLSFSPHRYSNSNNLNHLDLFKITSDLESINNLTSNNLKSKKIFRIQKIKKIILETNSDTIGNQKTNPNKKDFKINDLILNLRPRKRISTKYKQSSAEKNNRALFFKGLSDFNLHKDEKDTYAILNEDIKPNNLHTKMSISPSKDFDSKMVSKIESFIEKKYYDYYSKNKQNPNSNKEDSMTDCNNRYQRPVFNNCIFNIVKNNYPRNFFTRGDSKEVFEQMNEIQFNSKDDNIVGNRQYSDFNLSLNKNIQCSFPKKSYDNYNRYSIQVSNLHDDQKFTHDEHDLFLSSRRQTSNLVHFRNKDLRFSLSKDLENFINNDKEAFFSNNLINHFELQESEKTNEKKEKTSNDNKPGNFYAEESNII